MNNELLLVEIMKTLRHVAKTSRKGWEVGEAINLLHEMWREGAVKKEVFQKAKLPLTEKGWGKFREKYLWRIALNYKLSGTEHLHALIYLTGRSVPEEELEEYEYGRN